MQRLRSATGRVDAAPSAWCSVRPHDGQCVPTMGIGGVVCRTFRSAKSVHAVVGDEILHFAEAADHGGALQRLGDCESIGAAFTEASRGEPVEAPKLSRGEKKQRL